MRLSKVQSSKPKVPSGESFFRKLFRLARRPSEFGDRDGVALIITLIMLSIITFMAVTFLVLSQRERSSVNGDTDQKIARNASDAALARVCTELLTHMLVQTNSQDFDLLVSTNYINEAGLIPGAPGSLNPTNVNYDYLNAPGHPPLTVQDRNINIASLLFNPRPPVFVITNSGTGEGEFRYYYDVNRNGRFDPNGARPVVFNGPTGNPVYLGTNGLFVSTNLPLSTAVVSNNFVGDPEWIGVLERPEELHSADNRFIARYAYLVVPVGKTLDVNYIHNRAKRLTSNGEGFLRNQGVGTWEINLAAFLADLNTNAWWDPVPGYNYNTNSGGLSTGPAFVDANNFLNYRYGPPGYPTLAPANAVLAKPGALPAYNMDLYSDGPLMLGVNNAPNTPADNPSVSWSGSDNTNHFFSSQDIFSQMPPSFRAELGQLGTSNDSYNAYTFQRMLEQLGTDTAPDQNKLNINFKNTDIHGAVIPGMETNLIAWTPQDFFTNSANRILSQISNQIGCPLSSTYIPLYPTNFYTPAVHRALQVAANIYDSTTNRLLVSGQTNAYFPSVFRPVFTSQGGSVWISGYQEVTNTIPLQFDYWDLARASNNPGTLQGVNIYGVPWVIGAKKDFPNFNEYAMETATSFQRKLRLAKQFAGNNPIVDVKQLFEVGISNTLAMEAWNSYLSSYPRNLTLSCSNEIGILVTNQFGRSLVPPNWISYAPFATVTNIPANTWRPFVDQNNVNGSVIVPLQSGVVFFTNSMYLDQPAAQFAPDTPALFLSEASNAMPELYLVTTNRVQFSLVDTTVVPNRVVDFVNLESISTLDISQEARNSTQCGSPGADPYTYWCTNLMNNTGIVPGIKLNQGVDSQIRVSGGMPHLTRPQWVAAGADPNNSSQENSFRDFLMRNPGNTNVAMQTPFNPTVYLYQHTSWQVNDPLVHYTIGDLTDPAKSALDHTIGNPPLANIGRLNTRYRPWGGYLFNADKNTDYNIALKDPNLTQSADWDFPTNKLPNLGWLGRVHRGTPWQTVFMKSPVAPLNDWKLWSGDTAVEPNGVQDGAVTAPVADYPLFDLFTTAINENASQGKLSVNQTNLASWSAVLSGVNVLTNSATGQIGPAMISPAGVYNTNNPPPLIQIWEGINNARANSDTNKPIFLNRTFQHMGDILAAPQLTVASPFLNTTNVPGQPASLPGITDEVMERIPQQIMSLLTLNQNPRFVIYSFGQTLHPADHSLVIGGTFNGLCTNYQITAESATRAVVRVEGSFDLKDQNNPDPQHRYPPHLVVEQFNVLGPD